MYDLAAVLLSLLFQFVTAEPLAALVAGWSGVAMLARKLGFRWWWLGPAAFTFGYAVGKRRRGRSDRVAAVTLTGALLFGVWAGLLYWYPPLRFPLGVAVGGSGTLAGWVWLMSNHPTVSPWVAVRWEWNRWRHADALRDAVPASAGEGARVVHVKPLEDGAWEAVVVGPAGVSHSDLVLSLQDTLVESVLNLTGRKVAHIGVTGTDNRGRVRLCGTTSDPYQQMIRLGDLGDAT